MQRVPNVETIYTAACYTMHEPASWMFHTFVHYFVGIYSSNITLQRHNWERQNRNIDAMQSHNRTVNAREFRCKIDIDCDFRRKCGLELHSICAGRCGRDEHVRFVNTIDKTCRRKELRDNLIEHVNKLFSIVYYIFLIIN